MTSRKTYGFTRVLGLCALLGAGCSDSAGDGNGAGTDASTGGTGAGGGAADATGTGGDARRGPPDARVDADAAPSAPPDAQAPDAETDAGPAGCTTDDQCAPPTPYCESGVCSACRPGRPGCPCDGGACARGECLDDVCVDCERGAADCVCRANGTCQPGLTCADARCVACAPGVEGCPCEGDRCDEGLACADGTCLPDACSVGAQDCPCDAGACAAGLYCENDAVCRVCSSDVAGCPCAPGDTCEGGLRCEAGACAACPDDDRPEGCACADAGDCAAGGACDPLTLRCRAAHTCAEACVPHQLCDDRLPGDAVCIPDACEAGYLWEGERCVVEVQETCDGRDGTVDVSAECTDQGLACVESAGAPRCVETCVQAGPGCAGRHRACVPPTAFEAASCGACVAGYLEGAGGSCDRDPGANCVPDAPQSLVEVCAAERRLCVPEGPGARCGDCLQGYQVEPETGLCVAGKPCADRPCTDGEFCAYPQSGGAPRCEPLLCAPDEALGDDGACRPCALDCRDGLFPTLLDGACACREDVFCDFQFDGAGPRCHLGICPPGQARSLGGECVACAALCGDDAGETGRLWIDQSGDGTCLCETQPGWYVPLGGDNRPRQCDADGDGWINRTARATFLVRDPPVLANFRCEGRTVDRFTLQNESGQRRNLSLCEGAFVSYGVGEVAPCPTDITPIGLFEPDVLDSDGPIHADDAQFPVHGARRLHAVELNPLTKACVSPTGDFNANGFEDLAEEQLVVAGRLPGPAPAGADEFAFRSLSHYVELHTAAFEPGPPGAPGRYVIAERPRCDADFPLGYAGDAEYWRSCTRRRTAEFDQATTLVAKDFAWWGCDAPNGSCPAAEPLLPEPAADANGDHVPDHGLCVPNAVAPDAPWAGMNHHSQFRCVALKDTPERAWEISRTDVRDPADALDGARWAFNACGARACAEGEAGCVESVGTGITPRRPVIECTQPVRSETVVDSVGFVAARFFPGAGYFAGCIDEAAEPAYAALCPDEPGFRVPTTNPDDFGRLSCLECGGGEAGFCDDQNECTADFCTPEGACGHGSVCPPEGCGGALRHCPDPAGHLHPNLRWAQVALAYPQFGGDAPEMYTTFTFVTTFPYTAQPLDVQAPPGVSVVVTEQGRICPSNVDCRVSYRYDFHTQGDCRQVRGHYRFPFGPWQCAPGGNCALIDPAAPPMALELDLTFPGLICP